MLTDIINQTLKTCYIKRGKAIVVIKRYLRLKYRILVDEQSLRRRISQMGAV